MERLHGKPGERGQHGVVHEGGDDDAAWVAARVGHPLVAQEGQVEKEERQKEVHQDLDGLAGLAFAVSNQTKLQ